MLNKTNPEHNRSPSEPDPDETAWDLQGVTLFRTLGYVVGLPSFIVGTAIFMVGFALGNTAIINWGCILYSLALISIAGRPILLRLNPKNEKDAIKIAIASVLFGLFFYGLQLAALTLLGLEVI